MAATKLDLKMVMTNMMMGFYRSPYQTILFYVIFPFLQTKEKGSTHAASLHDELTNTKVRYSNLLLKHLCDHKKKSYSRVNLFNPFVQWIIF